MTLMSPRKKFNWHYLVIGLVALITHGLIVLNDGVYADGWLIYRFLEEKNWSSLSTLFVQAGLPLFLPLHWFMGSLPNFVLAYHVAALACLAASGLLIYEIGYLTGYVSRQDSLLIALLSLTYPAFQVAGEIDIFPYVFASCLFWLGVLLALLAEHRDKLAHYVLRIGALICFFLSFGVNSFLVFYFGFLLLLALAVRRWKSLSMGATLTRLLPRRLDYILLPFLYWILKEILFPRYGVYADYNRFTFSLPVLSIRLFSFLYNGVYAQFNGALQELLNQPALGLLGMLAVLWAATTFSKAAVDPAAKPYALFGYGALLLGLGIFPYIAVGLAPGQTGFSTRHSLLLSLPVALVIVATGRLLFSAPPTGFSHLGWIFLTVLLLGFGSSTIFHYLDWQARWAKDRSLMTNLRRLDGAGKYSVYWVDDQYPLGGEDTYRFYEWSAMFKEVWGDETRIGLDQRYSTPNDLTDLKTYFTRSYILSQFDPAGCQAKLTIQPGASPPTPAKLAVEYLFMKFLQPAQLDAFLSTVTRIRVEPVASPLAMDCHAP